MKLVIISIIVAITVWKLSKLYSILYSCDNYYVFGGIYILCPNKNNYNYSMSPNNGPSALWAFSMCSRYPTQISKFSNIFISTDSSYSYYNWSIRCKKQIFFVLSINIEIYLFKPVVNNCAQSHIRYTSLISTWKRSDNILLNESRIFIRRNRSYMSNPMHFCNYVMMSETYY